MIALGGLIIIASVIGILVLIVGVALPLFRAPRCEIIAVARLPEPIAPDDILGLGVDAGMDGRHISGLVWTADGAVSLVDLKAGEILDRQRTPRTGAGNTRLKGVEPCGLARYSLSWADGASSLVEIARKEGDGDSKARLVVTNVATIVPDNEPLPLRVFMRRNVLGKTAMVTRVAQLPNHDISVVRQVTTEIMDEDVTKTYRSPIKDELCPEIGPLTVDSEGKSIYGGTGDGRIIRWRLGDEGEITEREVVRAFADKRAVTSLALVLGDMSLAVGDAKGGLTTWCQVKADSKRKLRLVHTLEGHAKGVHQILPSARNKSLLSLSDDGSVHLDYMTSERHLLSIDGATGNPITRVALGDRGDLLLGLSVERQGNKDANTLTAWHLDGAHPEVSLKTLFGKVLYEGYDEPDYVWQTTGGDEFEPKFSLVPLLFGTLKGTLYAMVFALPLALGGAAYVSNFTTPRFKRSIKPVVEVMAAVPSVVVGFLAALWLAPLLERGAWTLLVAVITVPSVFLAFMTLWQVLRKYDWAKRVEGGYEFLAVLPVLLLGIGLAFLLAPPLEGWLFDGNFKQWLFDGPLGMRYDQRNSIVISFALGFAVVPIIFSIAEDAISSVPPNMSAASLALGASRWQTFWRVIMPSASPGVFAAVMIGFGRAVGETMIVLMATGNTPIVDWSPFNGMRTLAANIAVEMSEAPVNGTLFRVLFLCAVLLFLLTFFLNTTAEVVRQRLRKRFGRL